MRRRPDLSVIAGGAIVGLIAAVFGIYLWISQANPFVTKSMPCAIYSEDVDYE